MNNIIIYKPNVLISSLTGTTSNFLNSIVNSGISIEYGLYLDINQFDRKIINKLDIINNLINYLDDNTSKYSLNILIVNQTDEISIITQTGDYCIQISQNNQILDYLILKVGVDIKYSSYTTQQTTNKIEKVVIVNAEDNSPTIVYNFPISGTSWLGGDSITPYAVFLNMTNSGWTLDSLKYLFINHISDHFGKSILFSDIIFKLYKKNSTALLSGITENGIYDIFLSITDKYGNNIKNYIRNVVVDDVPPTIVYKSNVLNDTLTGITYASGVTFNLFYKNEIERLDIIDNIISYAYDNVDYNINKYMVNVIFSDISGNTYSSISNIGDYFINISISDSSDNITSDRFLLRVIYDSSIHNFVIYVPSKNIISEHDIVEPHITIKTPTIHYNCAVSGASWIGSGTTIPYNVKLRYYHNILSVWTLDSLKSLFVDYVLDSFNNIVPIFMLNFKLYKKGSILPLNGITKYGVYDILLSFTDNFGSSITNKITDIFVNDSSPDIIYKPYILTNKLTGYTNSYSGSTSDIEPNILIKSGFTLNLNGFDRNVIYKFDIIENVVNYVNDNIDFNLNKYMIDIVISGKHNDRGAIVYEYVTKPGEYCVKVKLINSNGNKTINYFIMKVVYDVSSYSNGYWQDDKVWVDFVLWLDHPIVPKL